MFKQTPTSYEQLLKETEDLAIESLAEEEFSSAKVLSFFLEHKNSPADSVNGVHEWVAKSREGKQVTPSLERVNSWLKDD
jgi:hypothetical protein